MALPAIPGTYYADLNLFCGFCIEGDEFGSPDATATVTALGNSDHDADDPVATPEPSTLALVGIGLVGVLACKRRRPAISVVWEPFA